MDGQGRFKRPKNFPMKDLTLDVNLLACYNGATVDLTGKKTFDTGFFRKNIGFGITNINIEINASLMPVIEITFKDLYGNTMMGTQRGEDNDIDTSILFAWPPPKFKFSFKGYLGRKVTWLLNLKTTNVNFVPSDGSYEIVCSFVPNQWGVFADIPFLYLIASKRLREDYYKSITYPICGGEQSFDSIFSYIRVGKLVDVKTQETSDEFSDLQDQLNSIKYNISEALYNTKKIEFESAITGFVNGQNIKGFQPFFLSDPIKDDERADALLKNSSIVNKLNVFLLLNMKAYIGSENNGAAQANGIKLKGNFISPNPPIDIDDFLKVDDQQYIEYEKKAKKVKDFIENNIKKVSVEIQKRIFQSSKTQIAKLTIGEILGQIAKDTGFILGLILENGFEGYNANKQTRDLGSRFLIGKNYPLVVVKGEELPALKENLEEFKEESTDFSSKYVTPNTVDIENYEWKFVNNFVEAISQGVAENLVSNDVANIDNLTSRINNAEILMGNPYKPYYASIVENLLVRSGIIAFITRSSDPNFTGNYEDSVLAIVDNDSYGDIRDLALKDMGNLGQNILAQLSFKDKRMLRRFCTMFSKAFTEEGYFAMSDGIEEDDDMNGLVADLGFDVSDEILDMKIVVDEFSSESIRKLKKEELTHNQYYEKFSEIKKQLEPNNPVEYVTIRDFFKHSYKDANNFSQYDVGDGQGGFKGLSFLKIKKNENYGGSYISFLLKNNGIYYSLFPAESGSINNLDDVFSNILSGQNNTYDKNYYIMFTGEDVLNLNGVMSSESDSGFDEDDQDEDEPDGVVYIKSIIDNDGETSNRVKVANEAIERGLMLDYNKMKRLRTTEDGKKIDWKQYRWDKKIKTKEEDGYFGSRMAYTIYSNSIGITAVWGLLSKYSPAAASPTYEDPCKNQRVALKAACDDILEKLNNIDLETNSIIGNVASKAKEHANAIYKQMHTIFHQWQSVATLSNGNICGSNPEGNVAELLEYKYGGCESHINRPIDSKIENVVDKNERTDSIFIYDYPLASVKGEKIDVKESVINIEPIYSPNANTTVLNIIQQICTKNNFTFVPFPGDPGSDDITDIFSPYVSDGYDRVLNFFHVMFTPTPETRTNLNDDPAKLTDYLDSMKNSVQTDAVLVEFGGVDNQVFKSVSVSTDSTKPTAESILNLQRLVDKENTNKSVSMDCSMLPVMEGRSYNASVDMLGNSQIYPMQYFFLEKMPLFGGLYQTLKVKHTITPNNMSTSFEGIRMRFVPIGGYGGIKPITISSLEKLSEKEVEETNKPETQTNNYVKNMYRQGLGSDFGGNVGSIDPNEVFSVNPPQEYPQYTIAELKNVFSKKGYQLREDNKLNIIGVRRRDGIVSNRFDDILVLYWNINGQEVIKYYNITTDPGVAFKPLSTYDPDGIAIMKEGNYKNVYELGLYNGYEVLRQAGAISFFREKWPSKNKKYKFDNSTLITKIIGAHIHRASGENVSVNVNNWSEGCQVFADPDQFSEFIGIVKGFISEFSQNKFDYTLLNELDFESYEPGFFVLRTDTKDLGNG